MTAKNSTKNKLEGYRKIGDRVKRMDRIETKQPVVNKVSFRDIFGVVSKFVQVGGDFV